MQLSLYEGGDISKKATNLRDAYFELKTSDQPITNLIQQLEDVRMGYELLNSQSYGRTCLIGSGFRADKGRYLLHAFHKLM